MTWSVCSEFVFKHLKKDFWSVLECFWDVSGTWDADKLFFSHRFKILPPVKNQNTFPPNSERKPTSPMSLERKANQSNMHKNRLYEVLKGGKHNAAKILLGKDWDRTVTHQFELLKDRKKTLELAKTVQKAEQYFNLFEATYQTCIGALKLKKMDSEMVYNECTYHLPEKQKIWAERYWEETLAPLYKKYHAMACSNAEDIRSAVKKYLENFKNRFKYAGIREAWKYVNENYPNHEYTQGAIVAKYDCVFKNKDGAWIYRPNTTDMRHNVKNRKLKAKRAEEEEKQNRQYLMGSTPNYFK